MLERAFEELSPVIRGQFSSFLHQKYVDADPFLVPLHTLYQEYAVRDLFLPRPVLTFFGYVSNRSNLNFEDVSEIGDIIFLSQLIRDLLAIHDDVVDEDFVKFGKPPIPVLFSAIEKGTPAYEHREITKFGKDMALFYGDYIVGIAYSVIENAPGGLEVTRELLSLTNRTIILNQQGQMRELLLQMRTPRDISVNEILDIYRLKAAHYCYAFPFEIGLIVARSSQAVREVSQSILLQIGTASQIIDDLAGAFPEILDQGKDTVGELIQLRRTVLLVLLCQNLDIDSQLQKLISVKQSCTREQAMEIKAAMLKYKALDKAIELVMELMSGIKSHIGSVDLTEATVSYLTDLVDTRILQNVNKVMEFVKS